MKRRKIWEEIGDLMEKKREKNPPTSRHGAARHTSDVTTGQKVNSRGVPSPLYFTSHAELLFLSVVVSIFSSE